MNRRSFLAAAASLPALSAADGRPIPNYRIVTKYQPALPLGMPGPYPGRVVTVHSPNCIDETTEKVDVPTVQNMIARGMTTLTGDKDPRDSWARFFNSQDFVGIKINCSGAPGAMSMPEVVTEIAKNLIAVGSGKREKGELIPLDVKPGDRVLFGKYSGTEITIDDQELLILREEEILAKLGGAAKAAGGRK